MTVVVGVVKKEKAEAAPKKEVKADKKETKKK